MPAYDINTFSLPRSKNVYINSGNFQRAVPMRSSIGCQRIASNEPLVEYFIPRSISEFNLSIINNESLPPLPPSALKTPSKDQARSREKMVTFEDDAIILNQTSKPSLVEDIFI